MPRLRRVDCSGPGIRRRGRGRGFEYVYENGGAVSAEDRARIGALAVRHRVVPVPSTVGPDFVVERAVPRESSAGPSGITRTT
jgi:hypothetical protein